MSLKKIIIAIDGHSSCGKSTLAKGLATHLGYTYLDSGAMYRAITLYFLENDIDYNNLEAVEKALKNIHIDFEYSKEGNRTFLNDKEVEEQIRSMQVSAHVSHVAAIPIVRSAMVTQQRRMGQQKGIVMDGRDIGSVVFPDAELKIFLTASQEERTQRRFLELKAKGKDVSLEEVRDNLLLRDQIDSTRSDSPLLKAPGAIVIDNTLLSQQAQLQLAIELAEQKSRN